MRRSFNRFGRRGRRLNESSVEKAVKTAIQKSEYPKVAKYLDNLIDFVDYINQIIKYYEVDDFDGYDADNLVSYGNSAAKIISKFPVEAEEVADELGMYADEEDDWTIARALVGNVSNEIIYSSLRRLGYM